jgi:hypothetical protein
LHQDACSLNEVRHVLLRCRRLRTCACIST